MTRSFIRASAAGLAFAALPGASFAQGSWTPGSEIIGQPIQVTTNGVTNTVTLSPGGQAQILTPAGNPVAGTWTAANGRYTVRTVVANDANELPVKQANNTSEKPFFVGRGANMPFDFYEAEDGQTGGGAAVVGAAA